MRSATLIPQTGITVLLILLIPGLVHAEQPVGTTVVDFFGYEDCPALQNEATRVVLCPQAGGRVLEYSLNGENVIYLDPEAAGTPAGGRAMTGGRFDIGPEQIIPRRDTLWSGAWTSSFVGPYHVRLTSQEDAATGVQLFRDFKLAPNSTQLEVTQTIRNVSDSTKEWCHWSRTFAKGFGIVILPTTQPSRFPNHYVMYEGRDLIQMRPENTTITHRDNYLIITGPPKFPKLGMDSSGGWFTYLAPNNLMFTKKFNVDRDRVYNEVAGLTVSIWYPDRPMVELEPIGPREVLQPGEEAAFTETWTLNEFVFPKDANTINLGQVKRLALDEL